MQFVIIAKRCSEFAKLHDYPCSCEQLQLLTDGCTNPISRLLLAQESTTRQRGASLKFMKRAKTKSRGKGGERFPRL